MLKHLFFLLLTLCSLTSYAHADKALIDVLNASQYDGIYLKVGSIRPSSPASKEIDPASMDRDFKLYNTLNAVIRHRKYNKIVLTLSDKSEIRLRKEYFSTGRGSSFLDFSLENGNLNSLTAAPSLTKIKHTIQCAPARSKHKDIDCSKLPGSFDLFLTALNDDNVKIAVKIATLKGDSYQRLERVDSLTGEKDIFFVYEAKIQKKFDSLAGFLVAFF